MKVLAEKLDAVIVNVTASETSVEGQGGRHHRRAPARDGPEGDGAGAAAAARAAGERDELLDAIKKIVNEERLTPAEAELVLEEAELFADAIARASAWTRSR